MNKVILIGRLTQDPELTTTSSGISVCRLSLAVNREFRNAEGERATDFFDIIVWRTQGENCQRFLRKGQQCAVSGKIETRSYEAKDGTKRRVTEIVADYVEFLARSESSSGSGGEYSAKEAKEPRQSKAQKVDELVDADDDLPF